MENSDLKPQGLEHPDNVETLDPALHEPQEPEGVSEVPIGVGKVFKPPFGGKNPPASKTTHASILPSEVIKRASRMYLSEDKNLLDLHGVADSSKVLGILCPEGVSPLVALASQDAYLITDDYKVVDVAASSWPIDLGKAADVRTCLKYPVQYGDIVGVVAGQTEQDVVIVQAREAFLAPIQDLQPLIIERELRTGS